jgi:hypothetical protein
VNLFDQRVPDDQSCRSQYRTSRYLRNVSDTQLAQRGRDVYQNFMHINERGILAPVPVAHPMHGYWRGRFLHFLEECVVRYGPFPNGIDLGFLGGKAPKPLTWKVIAALRAVDRSTLSDGQYLVKYGKQAHMETLKRGTVKISPASAFNDVTYNDAIRDNELEFTFWIDRPTEDLVRPHITGPLREPIPNGAAAVITQTAREDYYIYSMSASFDPRAFDDFEEYDSCLLIRKPLVFRDRLLGRVFDAVSARGCTFAPITYIDPMTPGAGDHKDAASRKHFRYAYQDEIRGIWLAQDKSKPLSAQLVDIGDLRDVAELIVLKH